MSLNSARLNRGSSVLIAITTCSRPDHVRAHLPRLARCAGETGRADLVLAIDGLCEPGNRSALEIARACGVSCVVADRSEGVGISKNRVVALLGGYDHYFFIEDDVGVRSARVFSEHARMHRETGIHHFSLHPTERLLEELAPSRICGGEVIRHAMYGGAQFNFFTRESLLRVGGWHTDFAEIRRGGHTEHSYRIFRSGLCPAPFNFVEGLLHCCRWTEPPSVVRNRDLAVAENRLFELENALIAERIEWMPFASGSEGRLLRP